MRQSSHQSPTKIKGPKKKAETQLRISFETGESIFQDLSSAYKTTLTRSAFIDLTCWLYILIAECKVLFVPNDLDLWYIAHEEYERQLPRIKAATPGRWPSYSTWFYNMRNQGLRGIAEPQTVLTRDRFSALYTHPHMAAHIATCRKELTCLAKHAAAEMLYEPLTTDSQRLWLNWESQRTHSKTKTIV